MDFGEKAIKQTARCWIQDGYRLEIILQFSRSVTSLAPAVDLRQSILGRAWDPPGFTATASLWSYGVVGGIEPTTSRFIAVYQCVPGLYVYHF